MAHLVSLITWLLSKTTLDLIISHSLFYILYDFVVLYHAHTPWAHPAWKTMVSLVPSSIHCWQLEAIQYLGLTQCPSALFEATRRDRTSAISVSQRSSATYMKPGNFTVIKTKTFWNWELYKYINVQKYTKICTHLKILLVDEMGLWNASHSS